MRYYNEAKTERTIRRKASWITLLIFAFIMSGMAILFVDQPEQYIPETVKEWLDLDTNQIDQPKERA